MALNDFLRPLTEDDPRRLESFDCGEPQMNAFIRRRAWEQQRNLINRTFLVLGYQPDVCPGFITLSAALARATMACKAFGTLATTSRYCSMASDSLSIFS